MTELYWEALRQILGQPRETGRKGTCGSLLASMIPWDSLRIFDKLSYEIPLVAESTNLSGCLRQRVAQAMGCIGLVQDLPSTSSPDHHWEVSISGLELGKEHIRSLGPDR